MRSQLQSRLKALKSEFDAGQKMLAEQDAKRAQLHDTLLRIHGAIQVLEEELTQPDDSPETPDNTPGTPDE